MPEPFLLNTNQTVDLMKMVRVSLETIRNMLQSGADGDATEQQIQQLGDLEQLLLDQEARLDAINSVLEEFNYSIAHELCAPLRRISGFTREIKQRFGGAIDSEGLEVLDSILDSSEDMNDLIEALMEVSRISHAELQLETVDLSGIARAVADELRDSAPERDATISIQPDVAARGDRMLLKTALEKLLHNAWKFTSSKEKPAIEFGSFPVEDRQVYYVRDNGVGFDTDNPEKLFHPFQRLHDTANFPGKGLGLTAVKRIIDRHAGQIWAEGAPDQGATFYFTVAPPS